MATGIYNRGPASPRRGHTISQLRALRDSHYHNPDTGTELQPEEADTHLQVMEQRRADRITAHTINKALKHLTRSRGRDWIASKDVVFRTIHGHRVPFKKTADPFL